MTTASLPNLFTPIIIGQRTIRNRIVFLPHATGLGIEGLPSAAHAAYYARRAEGGVGMIVQEATPVHVASLGRPTHVKGYDPRVAAPMRQISDAVHKGGAMMLAQISHRGLGAMPMFSGMAVWAPSPSRSPHTGEIAHALTQPDLKEVVAGFVQTARNCIEGGYDGVEVHATHGHLLNSFISSKLNWRRDAYGGSIENRMRLLMEVLEALRKLPLGILGIRIGQPAWNTGPDADDAPKIIRAIEPFVDYISVTGGTQETKHLNMGDFYSKPGYMLELARQVKSITKRPVIAAGRLGDPELAAQVLEQNMADMVGMARGLICDPEWARKVETKSAETIRPCIACNNCVERIDTGVTIGCLFNPRTGREAHLPLVPMKSPGAGKRVLVVGGGPAGMQAALRATERGMRVTLVEASGQLGGQMALAASVPGRDAFATVSDYLQRELTRSGAEVVLNKRLDANAPEISSYDGVIVATGAVFGALPDKPGIAVARVRAEAIVANPDSTKGKRAIVHIEDGMPAGPGAAEILLSQGVEVHIVTGGAELGASLPHANRQMLMARLLDLPFKWHFHSTLVSVSATGEAVVATRGQEPTHIAGIDFVVHAISGSANTELLENLDAASNIKLTSAGDCVAPRNIFAAVREGFDAADQLVSALSGTN